MTDDEIIKVLEWHVKADCCEDCEAFENGCNEIILTEKVLDLINRQKAEIEQLNKLKSEAIKEFAEKLKKEAFDYDVTFGFGREHCTEAVSVNDINRLVEEMTGGRNCEVIQCVIS